VTTARDLLLSDIQNLVKTPFSSNASVEVSKTLDRYRVQAKPTTTLREGITAREALGEDILASWFGPQTHELDDILKKTIDRYRMQLKQSGDERNGQAAPKAAPRAVGEKINGRAPDKKKAAPLPSEELPKKAKKGKKIELEKRATLSEPVAGGPQKRNRSRGQCPKCHSMGVVLARSYSGDEYFSCIYCGFQAYRASLDAELDLPLAAELLGRRFDDREEIEKKG
jgi:hypothetical protein